MNLTKTQWILIGVFATIAVWYFFLRKKKSESSYDKNVMIFGNENGYTNYELDGGSLESAYQEEKKKCSCTSCEKEDPLRPGTFFKYEGVGCNKPLANNGWSTVTKEQDCPCPGGSAYVAPRRNVKAASPSTKLR